MNGTGRPFQTMCTTAPQRGTGRRRVAIAWIVLAPVLLRAAEVTGDGAAPLSAAVSPGPLPDPGAALVRVMVALAVVLGLFGVGVWLYRNWQRLMCRGTEPKLRILEVRPLGGRQTLYVVAYEQERLLLAGSPQGVQLLTHLPPGTGEPAPVTQPQPASTPVRAVPLPHSFADMLRRALHPRS